MGEVLLASTGERENAVAAMQAAAAELEKLREREQVLVTYATNARYKYSMTAFGFERRASRCCCSKNLAYGNVRAVGPVSTFLIAA